MASSKRGGPTTRKAGKHHSERRDRIQVEVIDKMLALEWIPGKSTGEFARKYKLHYDTMAHIVADASRAIRLGYSDKEELKTRILASLDLGLRLALNAEQQQYDQQSHRWRSIKKPDLKALRDLIQLQAEVHGLTGVDAKAERPSMDVVGVDVGELNHLLDGLGYQAVPKPLPEKVNVHEQSSTAGAEPATRHVEPDE